MMFFVAMVCAAQQSVHLVAHVNPKTGHGETIGDDCYIDRDETIPSTDKSSILDSVPIYPHADSPQIAGEEFWIDIIVGEIDDPVSRLYGTAFLITWIETVVNVNDYPTVEEGYFLGAPYDEVRANGWWHNEDRDTVAVAVTRIITDRTANGDGNVMRILFRSRRETPDGTNVCFVISEVTANDSVGNPIILNPREFCLTIIRPLGIRPNPFTPNDDGYNDYVEFNLPELQSDGGIITIYDLWGKKVRQLEHGLIWNGRDENGILLNTGSYLYIVKSRGKVITKGIVGLAR